MDSSSEAVEAEGDGAAGDATSLYSVIKAQGMLTSKPKFVAVRPSSRASISSARSARSSISPIIEEDEDKESEIRQKNDQNDERPKDKSLDDGCMNLDFPQFSLLPNVSNFSNQATLTVFQDAYYNSRNDTNSTNTTTKTTPK